MKTIQKTTLLLLLCGALFGCATADPRITGQPQDWKGKPATDLSQFYGEPERVIKSADGSELWLYRGSQDLVIPKGESMSFGFGGLGSRFGGSGGFSSEKRPEDRTSRVEEVMRFKIQQGIIVGVYAARSVDGRTVRENHW